MALAHSRRPRLGFLAGGEVLDAGLDLVDGDVVVAQERQLTPRDAR